MADDYPYGDDDDSDGGVTRRLELCRREIRRLRQRIGVLEVDRLQRVGVNRMTGGKSASKNESVLGRTYLMKDGKPVRRRERE